MDRGAWWATVRGVTKNWPWLSDLACTHLGYNHTRQKDLSKVCLWIKNKAKRMLSDYDLKFSLYSLRSAWVVGNSLNIPVLWIELSLVCAPHFLVRSEFGAWEIIENVEAESEITANFFRIKFPSKNINSFPSTIQSLPSPLLYPRQSSAFFTSSGQVGHPAIPPSCPAHSCQGLAFADSQISPWLAHSLQ